MKEYIELDVSNRFSIELNELNHKLNQLRNNKIYELTKNKSDGYLSTNIEQIEKIIETIILSLENGYPSAKERIGIKISEIEL